MKILIDARLYGLENAGLGRYVMNLVGELSKIDSKHNYVILLRKKYFNELDLPDNWKKVSADIRHYSLAEQIIVPYLIYKEKPDIVHFPHFNVPILYFGKFTVTIHDLLMHSFKGKETTTRDFSMYFIKRLAYKAVFCSAVKRSCRIIVPSNAVRSELVNYYKLSKSKVTVSYEGLDEKVIDFGLNENSVLNEYKITKPYLIYVGNAYPHKNLSKAIEALKKVRGEGKVISFVIVSARNVFIERLSGYIAKSNAQGTVKLLGYVEDNKLGVLLKNSLAFIYPSLSEGFGLQGLESIAAGTLVLASDIPVFREIYRDNVLYFNPNSENSIANAVIKAMEMEKTDREFIVKKGQAFIKKYSWSKMAKEILNVYEEHSSCI